jgi:hypothetical protein
MSKKNWRKVHHFPQEWSNRTRIAADLIENKWSVIEFGAGEGSLGKILSHDTFYLPTDLIKRKDVFEIVDLDHPLNLSQKFDVGVAMGVLEYLNDLNFSLHEISRNVPNFITTYCCSNYRFVRLKSLRRYLGWKNHLSETEFEKILKESGFTISYKEIIELRFFYKQYIYKLEISNV